MKVDIERHPCFNEKAKHTHARVHLPVAPKCNVQCRFCDRRYDCVNESRPGVTSTVLTPEQSLLYVEEFMKKREISVVGIAGPGDPFANPEETLETMRLIRKHYPEMILCVSTNGLNLLPYIDELADLNVTHVTETICAVDPEIAAQVYAWIRPEKKPYRGIEAGEMMIERQLKAIGELKKHDIIVKVNSIIIPTVNESHVETVAETVSKLGADIFNPMGMIRNDGAEFGKLPEPEKETINSIKRNIALYIPVMHHCAKCRADAAGLLGENNIDETAAMIKRFSSIGKVPSKERPHVAVCTMEGMLINRHLGESEFVEIYKMENDQMIHVESRETPPRGSGDNRWENLSELLNDCTMLLCSGAGDTPRDILAKNGVHVETVDGMIEDAIKDIYDGKSLEHRMVKPAHVCSGGCTGGGGGCG